MPRFWWIEWNLDKIAEHDLRLEDVEHAFVNHLGPHQERPDGSFQTVGVTPSGRVILIVWRYDEEFDALEKDSTAEVVFVITAFKTRAAP
ncbi:MAG: hypothetical protein JXP34_06765 [Planctomycetes bacterium]|nr:hypothetical protein [Planctomycetota bacterium]